MFPLYEEETVNFSEMWQTWVRVLTSPNEATFAAERQKPTATLTTALIWMLIAGVVAGVLGLLQSMMMAGAVQGALPQMLDQANLPPEAKAQLLPLLNSGMLGGLGAGSLASIITVPISFLIGAAILWLVAKLLGGVGDYGRYAYLLSTFTAPLTIVSAVLGLIPFVGGCIAFILYIYQYVLTYYATKVEHQLSSGRAIIVVLIPIILVVLLLGCFLLFLGGLVAAMMNVQPQ